MNLVLVTPFCFSLRGLRPRDQSSRISPKRRFRESGNSLSIFIRVWSRWLLGIDVLGPGLRGIRGFPVNVAFART